MKNKNRILFLLIFVAIAGLFYICWQGIGQGHLLSYRNIDKGLDLSGGVYIVYEAQDNKKLENSEILGEVEALEDLGEVEALEALGEVETLEALGEVETLEDLTEADTLQSTNTATVELDEPTWDEKMKAAIYMLQQRLDRKGWSEATVYQEGTNRIRIELPGIEDVDAAVKEIGQTAQLSFTSISGEVLVEGKDVVNAYKSVITNQYGLQEIVVNIEFNEKGTADFAKATEENIGNIILITLDDAIISLPTVNTAITDGKAIITGSFTSESAEELASLIRAGSLPFNLEILEMNTVGATLGANALATSILGGAVGLGLVLIFMLLFYRMNGFAANLALIIYILIELILLNFFNMILTLHGIAGIILSIGMAVDANVIIFERIREELSAGRSIKLSINKAFSRALPAILDSNITTLIACAILYWLGTGPIKGFAQTLILGIVISMFTSLFITRIILNIMVNSGIKNPKLYGGR